MRTSSLMSAGSMPCPVSFPPVPSLDSCRMKISQSSSRQEIGCIHQVVMSIIYRFIMSNQSDDSLDEISNIDSMDMYPMDEGMRQFGSVYFSVVVQLYESGSVF
ncbi:hypothetical protein GUJ93_ZPchr0003g18189 [Zizania palustris]|uniref:Uncharacterized protein n=1 Tax=Zizania palustris TaxID=103762 RepID=A0A8J5RNC5_ZIZPA|nr:hypothetical protein GUJ93_ZPchr0003g18189 [Zizania palustris]